MRLGIVILFPSIDGERVEHRGTSLGDYMGTPRSWVRFVAWVEIKKLLKGTKGKHLLVILKMQFR